MDTGAGDSHLAGDSLSGGYDLGPELLVALGACVVLCVDLPMDSEPCAVLLQLGSLALERGLVRALQDLTTHPVLASNDKHEYVLQKGFWI